MPRPPKQLPGFLEPMLCGTSAPFDSPDHLYEPKWDGFRSLALIQNGKLHLIGRKKTDFTARFPELSPLARLPNGTLLDGEIIILKNGKPDFTSLLAKKRPIGLLASYVAFDLLYQKFKPLLTLPLEERQGRLEKLFTAVPVPDLSTNHHPLIPSTPVPGGRGAGLTYFQRAADLGLEGIIAKRRGSTYEPGLRTGAWIKIKARQAEIAAIIGYELSQKRENDLRSLVLAGEVGGELICLGQVGTGFTAAVRAELLQKLRPLHTKRPLLPTCGTGMGAGHQWSGNVAARKQMYRWVRPELFCRVYYHERLPSGALRQASFDSLVDPPRNLRIQPAA